MIAGTDDVIPAEIVAEIDSQPPERNGSQSEPAAESIVVLFLSAIVTVGEVSVPVRIEQRGFRIDPISEWEVDHGTNLAIVVLRQIGAGGHSSDGARLGGDHVDGTGDSVASKESSLRPAQEFYALHIDDIKVDETWSAHDDAVEIDPLG